MEREGRLAGKVAVVTGGGSGIGEATVRLFCEEGATVVYLDANDETGRAVADDLAAAGAPATFVAGDVSNAADVDRLVSTALARHGRVDVLFNNAGYNLHRPIAEVAEDDWNRLLAVNLGGVFLCCRAVLPHMVAAGGGSIVNNASSLGLIGFPKVPAYSASKGGIIALTRQLALDYAPHQVRVNCVCPGPTLTPRIERDIASGAITPDVLAGMTDVILLGRMGRPREVAQAVLFLASDAASFITGVALPVDGGQTAH
jgi:NAD(P)-dependent dehydrogenase (short-subunit alcohol dehydrogenase family)